MAAPLMRRVNSMPSSFGIRRRAGSGPKVRSRRERFSHPACAFRTMDASGDENIAVRCSSTIKIRGRIMLAALFTLSANSTVIENL